MDIQQYSMANQTLFSIALASHLFMKSPNSNVVLSPVSIHVVLSLLAAGSSGQTHDQLLSFLKANNIQDLNYLSSQLVTGVLADGSPSGGPRLSFSTGVWVDQTLPLKPSFRQVVDTDYRAASDQVDFRTKAIEIRDEINQWAEEQTGGLIKELLPSDAVNSITRLIFANAIYFKGAWREKFDASMTKDHDFHLMDGSKVQVPFMTTDNEQFIREYKGFKVLGLPYVKGKDKRSFTMYIYLPDEKDGLPSLLQKIGSQSDFLDRHVPRRKVEVGQFLIPKFKISHGFQASDMLKELGLVLPFSEEGGGLTEMVESDMGKELYVSSIHHKAFLEVNEEGTVAVAVTGAIMMVNSAMASHKVDFVADHPFVFVIREDTSGAVLFTGQVADPS